MAETSALPSDALHPAGGIRRIQREDKLASVILLAGIAVTALLVVGIIQTLARG